MENWKNQQDIKQKIDKELAKIVSDEKKLEQIISLARMEELGEIGDKVNGGIIIMKNKKRNRSLKTIFKVAIIAAAISMVSVVTVFGYEYFVRMYQADVPEKYQEHLNEAKTDAPVYEVEDTKKEERVENNNQNIVVEWGKYSVTNHEAYVNVTVTSVDGTPILEETYNKAPLMASLDIGKISVMLDGEKKTFFDVGILEQLTGCTESLEEDDETLVVCEGGNIGVGCTANLVDFSEDLTSFTYEIHYQNYDVDLSGKEIVIELENFCAEYYVFEDLENKGTVADLISGGIESDITESTVCTGESTTIVFEEGDLKGLESTIVEKHGVHLNPGKNKIYFSEQYPECYIDSFGFLPNEDGYDGKKEFYMTIVCDDKSKEELKNITFQSTITGYDAVRKNTFELSDGRLQCNYTVNWDKAYNDINGRGSTPIDTTIEHLKTVVLKKSCERKWEIFAEGKWGMEFTISDEAKSFNAIIDLEIPSYDGTTESFMATNVEIDAMGFYIEGNVTEEFDFVKFLAPGKDYPVVHLQDGSVVSVKMGDDIGVNSTSAKFSYKFTTVVNIENITSIEWHGVTVWSAK